MKTPSAVINWTGSSNREIKKRNSSEKRSNKGRSGRISDEELKNMTDELDEIERRERLAWKPGPRYRRTAESFLTTEYRRKLAADIEKYARQVKEVMLQNSQYCFLKSIFRGVKTQTIQG